MKLSTGKVAFPIEFDNGDCETIYFNPNDPDLSIRLKDFQKKVEERLKDVGDIKLNEKGEPDNIELIEDFRKVQGILCEEIDNAFNGDISAKVFKHCSPFALVDGNYFIIQFIEAIKPEIERKIRESRKEIDEKMKKHLLKYGK